MMPFPSMSENRFWGCCIQICVRGVNLTPMPPQGVEQPQYGQCRAPGGPVMRVSKLARIKIHRYKGVKIKIKLLVPIVLSGILICLITDISKAFEMHDILSFVKEIAGDHHQMPIAS